jgi:hypothetical protein
VAQQILFFGEGEMHDRHENIPDAPTQATSDLAESICWINNLHVIS